MKISKIQFLGETKFIYSNEVPSQIDIRSSEFGTLLARYDYGIMSSFLKISDHFRICSSQKKLSVIRSKPDNPTNSACSIEVFNLEKILATLDNKFRDISVEGLKNYEPAQNELFEECFVRSMESTGQSSFITYEYCNENKHILTVATDNKVRKWDLFNPEHIDYLFTITSSNSFYYSYRKLTTSEYELIAQIPSIFI